MELVLGLHNGNQVRVACDGRASHAFALETVAAADPAALYNALFPPGSPAHAALASADHLALVLDEVLDSLPWELSRGPEGDLALQLPLVRLTPPGSRQPAPKLDSPLRVLAVPSNPVARDLPPLNIAGEWRRLREIVQKLTHSARLERVTPPTLDSLRRSALRSPQAVVHFMGHGGQTDEQAVLFFESDAGGLQPVTAKDFALSVGKQTFLVTLNACVSAAPGPTEFSNLARLLVERGLPYALGMSASIPDGDALTFSRALYENLAAGVDVEQAIFQARRSLLRGNPREWLVGVPVLYSSLEAPAGGFATPDGQPQIDEGQPPLEVTVLPRAEGAFQGRVDELLALGQALTGEPRPKLLTIHGAGGQGKTALAREAVERFAHAWPGGVWAVSLENKPNRTTFCFQLAQFLKLPTDNFPQQPDLERVILARLAAQRTLIVLDNAETFTEAVRAAEPDALDLAAFLKEGLLGTDAGLLVTSREPLGWPGEQSLPLEGLSQSEGAALFTQSAPQRQTDIQAAQAAALSARLDGHPLALLLLGLAFNEISISLEQFIAEHETRLLNAENKYKAADHRHRTLYASIETSTRYLSNEERALLSGLWIFQAPFLAEVAARVFLAPDLPEDEANVWQTQVAENLHMLYRHGLLLREVETLAEGNIVLYRNLSTVGLFEKHYLEQEWSFETLQAQIGKTYAALLKSIYDDIDSSNWASYLAVHCRKDLEACLDWVEISERGWYANYLGRVLDRTGDRRAGQHWLEQGLTIAQGFDQYLELHIRNNMAELYRAIGQPDKALEFFEQTLPLIRKMGKRADEASTLNNMANAYKETGKPEIALELFGQALSLMREVGYQPGEAKVLSNMAMAYNNLNQPSKALELCEQALLIQREIRDQAGEAITLSTMARVYDNMNHLDKALELCEQALPITRRVGDPASEGFTLNIMANIYQAMGHPDKALELHKQYLLIAREISSEVDEGIALSNMAELYRSTDQLGKALELYEQALPIRRKAGRWAGEATTLKNMANIYTVMGQPQRSLNLLEQALHIHRLLGDRLSELSILNEMATVYHTIQQQDRALIFFEQALHIAQEVGDRASESSTLNNMAAMYRAINQPQQALTILEQALIIAKHIGDRGREATALNNMAGVYYDIHQPQYALELFRQALFIRREIGDRVGEATTLNNMSGPYLNVGEHHQALAVLEQALLIRHELSDNSSEANTLNNIALILYGSLFRPLEAIHALKQAIARLEAIGLERDASGITLEEMRRRLVQMQTGQSVRDEAEPDSALSALSPEEIQVITINTLAVLTNTPEKRIEWQVIINNLLEQASTGKMPVESEFFTAILALLDGKPPQLSTENPYTLALQAILQKLQAPAIPPVLPTDFVAHCVGGLTGEIAQKMSLADELAAMAKASADAGELALIDTVQRALFGAPLESLGQELYGAQAQVWQEIVRLSQSE